MGIVELFIYLVLVVLIGYLAVWILGQWAPGHPSIIDKTIWIVVVLIVMVVVFQALGLTGYDPRVPRLRS